MNTVAKEVQDKRRSDEEAQLEKPPRKQKAMFEKPLSQHLFSLEEIHERRSGICLREISKAIPEDIILEALPVTQRSVSRKGRKPFPRRAKLRALEVSMCVPAHAEGRTPRFRSELPILRGRMRRQSRRDPVFVLGPSERKLPLLLSGAA